MAIGARAFCQRCRHRGHTLEDCGTAGVTRNAVEVQPPPMGAPAVTHETVTQGDETVTPATRCYFADTMFELVREALGREVVVKGLIRSFAHEEGREISETTELALVLQRQLPGPEDVRGVIPDLTGGTPSEEWLKERWRGRHQA